MTLLSFNSKYVVSSSVQVTTTSTALVNDTEATQAITLTATKTVLVVYSAHNVHGSTEHDSGKAIAINIGGVDYATTWTASGTNLAHGGTTFWIGSLGAGNHTIQGRFSSKSATNTVTIDERTLLVYILNGDEYYFIEDSTDISTTSTVLVDDPNATQAFTPSGDCKALLLYVSGNDPSVAGSYCKIGAVNISGADYSEGTNTGGGRGICTVSLHYAALASAAYTLQGRYRTYNAALVAYIHNRVLGVLLFENSALVNYVSDNTAISTSSAYPVDDTSATVNRTTTDTRELLVIGIAWKYSGAESDNGRAYGIKIDANDRSKTRHRSRGTPYPSEVPGFVYAEQLAAAAHTIQGRYGNNNAAETVLLLSRRIVMIWLSTGAPPPSPIKYPTWNLLSRGAEMRHRVNAFRTMKMKRA